MDSTTGKKKGSRKDAKEGKNTAVVKSEQGKEEKNVEKRIRKEAIIKKKEGRKIEKN